MKHLFSRLMSLVAGAILLCSSALAQNGGLRFSLTDLGVFGGNSSEAWAINDSVMIVGSFDLPGGGKRCFSLQNGVLLKFDGGSKPPKCEALALDHKGNIAGAIVTPASGSVYRAFRYDNGGKIVVLPLSPGYDYSMGLGLYEGTVVGGIGNTNGWSYCDDCPFWKAGLQAAVKWDANGLTTIVTGSSDFGNYARGINKGGAIVGRVYYPYSLATPWFWQNGVLTDLPIMPNPDGFNDFYGQAYAINDSGVIVGGGTFDDGNWHQCVELWNSHSLASLPTLRPNCANTFIGGMAISIDNWVVGYGDFQPYPPFLSVPDPSCVLTNLNTLLDGSGDGWTLISANGINRLHQIVGAGITPKNGSVHAVLLTPNGLPLCYPD